MKTWARRNIYSLAVATVMVITLTTILIVNKCETLKNSTVKNVWPNRAGDTRCEKANDSDFLREPANALSTLVFVLVGVYAIAASIWDHRYVPLQCKKLAPRMDWISRLAEVNLSATITTSVSSLVHPSR